MVRTPVMPTLTLPLRPTASSKMPSPTVDYNVERGTNGYVATRITNGQDELPRIAWRMWQVRGNVLLSGSGAVWPSDGPIVASCDIKTKGTVGGVELDVPVHLEPAPVAGCSCGLYTARTFDWLHGAGYARSVVGLVSGWGRWVQHQEGWRFERAYPLALVVFGESGDGGGAPILGDVVDGGVAPELLAQAKSLANTYRIPVAVGGVGTAESMILRIVRGGHLPAWTSGMLPTDIKASMSEKRGRK